jgi:LemA protein
MKKTLIILAVVVVLVLIVGGWIMGFYNAVIQKDQAITAAWAQVENQYQRRFDLIPNLVESVKGVLTQEQKVFGDLAEARTKYAGAQTVSDKVSAASSLESALGRLLVIMENYPQLKSSENVTNLMVQLEGTENRISVERQRFNEVTQSYNTYIKQFPNNTLAGMFGFAAKPYFEAAAGAETAPKVNLNLNQ